MKKNISFKSNILGNLNQNKCYVLFSTFNTRNSENQKEAIQLCEKLKIKHLEFKMQSSVQFISSGISNFTYGVDDLDYSVKIKKDYLEDSRLISEVNPYFATWKILKNILWNNLDYITRSLDTNSNPILRFERERQEPDINEKTNTRTTSVQQSPNEAYNGLLSIISQSSRQIKSEETEKKEISVDNTNNPEEVTKKLESKLRKSRDTNNLRFLKRYNFNEDVKENLALLKKINITSDALKSKKTPKNVNNTSNDVSATVNSKPLELNDEFSTNVPTHMYDTLNVQPLPMTHINGQSSMQPPVQTLQNPNSLKGSLSSSVSVQPHFNPHLGYQMSHPRNQNHYTSRQPSSNSSYQLPSRG